MKGVSNHLFSMIPRANIPRSVFDRSHNRKMTLDADYLVPIFVDEVLPGDSFKLDFDLFCRMTSPLTTPVMDNLYLDTFWFFVPNRLVWDNWQKFCGEQINPGDSTDYLIPTIKFSAAEAGGNHIPILPLGAGTASSGRGPGNVAALANCFGLPIFANALYKESDAPLQQGYLRVNALPFRAYNLIWNEWFRDQNLQDSKKVYMGDADAPELSGSSFSQYGLWKRAKRHDYFSSALPWPQKGPGVELSIGEFAPVSLYTTERNSEGEIVPNGVFNGAIGGMRYSNSNWQAMLYQAAGGTVNTQVETIAQGATPEYSDITGAYNNRILGVDLTSANPITINSLRTAFQLQRWYEAAARSGTRYTEILRGMFGVVSPDARLQRPEYLGGSSQPFVINPISQTSATTNITPQGNLVAIGMTGSSKRGFRKSFVEHGYIIGLANIRADVNYQQGVNRMWSRRTKFDFYWPAFAHLGEQAILNKEIFVQGDAVLADNGEPLDEQVFGYQERWAEYRYKPNEICGVMNSVAKNNLDIWHVAQYFQNMPKLNASFIESSTPIARVSAVQDEPGFLLDINFNIKAARPMPVYSVPGLIDHF